MKIIKTFGIPTQGHSHKTSNMKEIFVFGSNTQGIHGAGAAQYANIHHGAIQGIPMGLQGLSYAIITKHLPMGERSIPLHFIQEQINVLISYAKISPNLIFNVSRIGCGYAGFTEDEIAPMFTVIPPNIKLCPEFKQWLDLHPLIGDEYTRS